MFSASLRERAAAVIALYEERGLTLVTAELCTGGLIAGLMTETARVVRKSSNAASSPIPTSIQRRGARRRPLTLSTSFGAVSAEVASGDGRRRAGTFRSDSCTFGHGTGSRWRTAAKPVGLVYFGYGRAGQMATLKKKFGDIGRSEVRLASVETALDLLLNVALF